MDSPFLGMIIPWPITFAPMGWAFCQGQDMNIAQNQALYSLIGTTYGQSTSTTFKLPNLCGRTIVGCGVRIGSAVNYTLGMAGGNEFTTATLANMPSHNHTATNTVTGGGTASFTILAKNASGNTNTPSTTSYFAISKDGSGRAVSIYNNDATVSPSINIPGGSITIPQPTVQTTISPMGTGTQMTTVSPFMAMNYIIALEGLYPVRQ